MLLSIFVISEQLNWIFKITLLIIRSYWVFLIKHAVGRHSNNYLNLMAVQFALSTNSQSPIQFSCHILNEGSICYVYLPKDNACLVPDEMKIPFLLGAHT